MNKARSGNMAKGRSSRKQDNFLRNILIGFVGLFVVLGLTAVLLNAFGPKNDYNDFPTIRTFDQVTEQDETTYAVYFYSESCGACSQIKADTMSFGNENALDIKMYLVDTDKVTGSVLDAIGPNGEVLESTPTMMIVRNGAVSHFFNNTANIVNFYNSVEDGSFTFN